MTKWILSILMCIAICAISFPSLSVAKASDPVWKVIESR